MAHGIPKPLRTRFVEARWFLPPDHCELAGDRRWQRLAGKLFLER